MGKINGLLGRAEKYQRGSGGSITPSLGLKIRGFQLAVRVSLVSVPRECQVISQEPGGFVTFQSGHSTLRPLSCCEEWKAHEMITRAGFEAVFRGRKEKAVRRFLGNPGELPMKAFCSRGK